MAARNITAQSPIVGVPPNSITWNEVQCLFQIGKVNIDVYAFAQA